MPFPKSLRDHVSRLLTDLRAAPNADKDSTRRFFHDGPNYVSLNAAHVAACHRVVNAVHKQVAPLGEWSAETIRGRLNKAILAVRFAQDADSRSRIAEETTSFLASLASPIAKWAVHFRIDGFYDECLPLTIGKTSFLASSESLADHVLRPDGEESPNLAPNLRDRLRAHARKEITEEFAGHAWARVSVRAAEQDQQAAYDLGEQHLRLTLDVLNFYADIWRPGAYRARLALGCEVPPAPLRVLTVREGLEPGGVSTQFLGPFDNVWLPPLDSEEATALGLDRVSGLLANAEAEGTEISRRLLASLRWGGRATLARRPDESLLLYLIALEGLIMGPKKSGTIVYQLARRVAHVFREDSRHEIVKDVERLYDLRSRVVHTGVARVEEADVELARYLAKEAAVAVLRRSEFATMTTNAELDNWFELRILGQPAGVVEEPQ